MGTLSDIFSAGNGGNIDDLWNKTAAADEFGPLPPGTYECRLEKGELRQTRTGKPEYVLTFKVLEGEYKYGLVWHSLYLTEAALPMAKRDLGKLGVTTPEQLEQPIPSGIRCKVRVVLHRGDDGTERNRVRSFEVLGVDPPEVDPFAPEPTGPASLTDSTSREENEAEGAEPSSSESDLSGGEAE